jgi:hemerythrin-like metal-binding protein
MSLIPWKSEFELGIEEIDEQHKKVLAIINKLYDLFNEKKLDDQVAIDSIIKELADYAIYHFQTEENYFKIYGYEQAQGHIEVHNQYRAKIEDWRKRYDENKDPAIFFEISNFLQDWWTWHINNTDRAYVPFMKANGVK